MNASAVQSPGSFVDFQEHGPDRCDRFTASLSHPPMLILSAQELESKGIPYLAASTILFQERLFVKGQSFSQRVRQVAIDLYAEYLSSGIHCLLVESAEQLTFWRELESLPASVTLNPRPKPGSRPGQPQPIAQPISLEDVIRIDLQHSSVADAPEAKRSASPNQAGPQTTVQIKYRGAIVTLPKLEMDIFGKGQSQSLTPLSQRRYRGSAY